MVLGRGQNDGTTRCDAIEIELINDDEAELSLFYYYEENGNVNEIRGDLNLKLKSKDMYINSAGFCFQRSGGSEWDCLTMVKPFKTIEAGKSSFKDRFEIFDGHSFENKFTNGTPEMILKGYKHDDNTV